MPGTNNQLLFGPGLCAVTPIQGWGGVTPLDSLTPVRVAVLQSGSAEIDTKLTPLYGMNVFPVAQGASTGTAKGKIKTASVCGWLLNALLFSMASTPPAGSKIIINELHTIPATTPFTVTVASTNPIVDLGVFFTSAVTGGLSLQLLSIGVAPTAAGSYQFGYASGTATWTFFSADAGKQVALSYSLQPSTANPMVTYSMINPVSGFPPKFSLQFVIPYQGLTTRFTFPSCAISKLSFPSKINGWVEAEYDWEADTGQVETGIIMTMDTLS
jgi:hypothetical protein